MILAPRRTRVAAVLHGLDGRQRHRRWVFRGRARRAGWLVSALMPGGFSGLRIVSGGFSGDDAQTLANYY